MTAIISTVPPSPGPDGPGLGESADPAITLTWAELAGEIRQAERTNLCTHPVRLKGRIDAVDLATGELRTMYDTTAQEPGGVLHVACGNRRESACPACSQVYKRDARQLVKAGLAGGKGIPETIAAHPCVFATFTAPSFGPVHSRRKRDKTILPCRPRRDAPLRVCPHGRDVSCPRRHAKDDPLLGRALCLDCYDYTAAVLFNAHAGDLWRRFTTYLPRHLARHAGITQRQLHREVTVRFVKVAEGQARGVIHYHAVIRLDGPGESYQPPGPAFTTGLLEQAIRSTAAAIRFPVGPDTDHPNAPVLALRFGAQVNVRHIRRDSQLPATGHELPPQAVGNYIAKYATKDIEAPGLPSRRITTRHDLDALHCATHYQRMITTAWELGGGRLTPSSRPTRLCRWAHQLGHGGHFLSKSQCYSVTFGQLRRARTEHRKAQCHPEGERDPWGRPVNERTVLVLSTWTYDGPALTITCAAELALAYADRARAHEWPLRDLPLSRLFRM
ncbi:MAG: replication initiator [Streptosporangiaceae bacterium]